MKKIYKFFAVSFFVGLGFFSSLPEAEALKIVLDNHRNQTLDVALVYYDLNQGSWCCQGWWVIKPLGERKMKLPHDPKRRIYYYVQSDAKPVYKRAEGWSRWDVISNVFKYYEHDGCPNGKNYRSVYFNCSSKATGHTWKLRLN